MSEIEKTAEEQGEEWKAQPEAELQPEAALEPNVAPGVEESAVPDDVLEGPPAESESAP